MKTIFCTLLLLCLASGCAKYEYDIMQPADLAQHIGSEPAEVAVDPLMYSLQAYDNRLVVLVRNPTEDAITLQGSRSVVVTGDGQSHPLQERTIAPGTYIKLIFPPLRPRIERVGPSIGIGVGGTISLNDGRNRTIPPAVDTEPRYLAVYDDNNAVYWDWDGDSAVTFTFSFMRNEDTFSHTFVIQRGKVK